jgi:hypothetical protein
MIYNSYMNKIKQNLINKIRIFLSLSFIAVTYMVSAVDEKVAQGPELRLLEPIHTEIISDQFKSNKSFNALRLIYHMQKIESPSHDTQEMTSIIPNLLKFYGVLDRYKSYEYNYSLEGKKRSQEILLENISIFKIFNSIKSISKGFTFRFTFRSPSMCQWSLTFHLPSAYIFLLTTCLLGARIPIKFIP